MIYHGAMSKKHGNPIVLLVLFACFRQYLAVIFCVVRGHASAIKWLALLGAR